MKGKWYQRGIGFGGEWKVEGIEEDTMARVRGEEKCSAVTVEWQVEEPSEPRIGDGRKD